ncbi:hypothetical protein SYNPS1DRAFT_25091, partial [Syncephalis pseudoplumigaleata]
MPHPLPISPSTSGHGVEYANSATGTQPPSAAHRSGLLKPATGSAAVSPTPTPLRLNPSMP